MGECPSRNKQHSLRDRNGIRCGLHAATAFCPNSLIYLFCGVIRKEKTGRIPNLWTRSLSRFLESEKNETKTTRRKLKSRFTIPAHSANLSQLSSVSRAFNFQGALKNREKKSLFKTSSATTSPRKAPQQSDNYDE